jgi:hypothetical protein
MDREKLVAAMRQEVQQIVALQTMLKNVAKAEEQGYQTADQRRLDAIADLFAAGNESLMTAYYKVKDESGN